MWSSNVMAVLGMRPLFFLLAGLIKGFRFLKHGLAAILGFVGVKLVVEQSLDYADIEFHLAGSSIGDALLSLGVILAILTGSVVLSILLPADKPDSDDAAGGGGDPPTPPPSTAEA